MTIPTAEIIVHTVVMLSTKAGISDEELEEAASRSSSEVGLVRAELCGAREYFSRAPSSFARGGALAAVATLGRYSQPRNRGATEKINCHFPSRRPRATSKRSTSHPNASPAPSVLRSPSESLACQSGGTTRESR